jgi:hypothetical protein
MSTPPAQSKGRMQIKVYLVCQRLALSKPGEPNTRILAARLTRSAAQELVDKVPGTFIERQTATK